MGGSIELRDGELGPIAALASREQLHTYVNGDITQPRPHFFDMGSCLPLKEIKEGFFAALLGADLLMGSDDKPAKNRWQTCTKVSGKISGANMTHNLLDRCLEKAFPNWDAMLPREEDDEFRAIIKSKTFRSRKCCADLARQEFQALLTWAGIPLDNLLLRLQHLDAAGEAVNLVT